MQVYSIDRDDYGTRLRLIEGQVRGVSRMIEQEEYCLNVLTQICSITSALRSVGLGLLDEHLRSCVRSWTDDTMDQGDRSLRDVVKAIERLLRA